MRNTRTRPTVAAAFAVALFSLLSNHAPARAAGAGGPLAIVTDRPGAVYRAGERAGFLVTCRGGAGAPAIEEASYVLDRDGMPPATAGNLDLAGGRATVEGTLAEPGFLRCRVSVRFAGGKVVSALAAAGFDPLAIRPSMPPPDDFDEFWAAQKARLAGVPLAPALAPVESPEPGVECFDAQIPCVPPRPVSGYFARPLGAAPRSLPAILFVHGAGVRGSNLAAPAGFARAHRALAMDINAHGIPNGRPEVYYKGLAAGELKEYRIEGRDDRERCYFLGMFLRLARALEFLRAQPQWDGKTLIVQGSSQGGGQSIAAAGLDPRVTFIAAGVPAICDHSGRVIGRINGWPKLVPDIDGKPDPVALRVARYFDCMNFATRARAEAIVSVGFIDGTCPPTSVYAAYNNLPGKRRMIEEPLMGHAVFPGFSRAAAEAIAAHIAASRSP